MLMNGRGVPGCCYEPVIISNEGVVEVFFRTCGQWNRGWLLWLY